MVGRPVPRFINPADYFMKILSTHYPKKPEEEKMLDELVQHYHKKLAASIKAE